MGVLQDWGRRSNALVRQHVAKTDQSYSVAQVVEPLFSNKGLLLVLVPVQFVGLLGALLRNDSAEFAAILVAIWYVGFILACTALSVRWFLRWKASDAARDEVEHSRSRLAEALALRLRSDASYFRMLSWTDDAKILNEDGDVKLTRTVTIRSGQEPVPMLWSSLESYGALVSSDLVKVSVKQVLTGGGAVDVEHDVVWKTEGDNLRSHVYLYADTPVGPGREASYRIVWEWPSFYKGLVSGGKKEKFDYKFTRECDELHIILTLPRLKNHSVHVDHGQLGAAIITKHRKCPRVRIDASALIRDDSVTSTVFLNETN